jgi:hypothetical protein
MMPNRSHFRKAEWIGIYGWGDLGGLAKRCGGGTLFVPARNRQASFNVASRY